MAFGQQSGPPASAKQVQELLALLNAAGHTDFRDGRGPMGFTQRQAGGRFTRDEAAAFIAVLEGSAPAPHAPAPQASVAPRPAARTAAPRTLTQVPAEQLAAELRRRGWKVTEP